MKPALFSSRAYEGGAWKAKQSVLDAPHFDWPRTVSVPSRLPTTTSPFSWALTALEKNPAPPSGDATMAMSPTHAIETGRGFDAAAGRPTQRAAATSTARRASGRTGRW